MNAKSCYRLAGVFLVLALLVTAWTLVVEASVPAAPLQNVPDGSTISGTLITDDWGPGTVTVTGDITIPLGVTIVITPGTTVQMAITDGLNSGVDPARIEWTILGTLQADGPVTFTSQSGTPAPENWYGLCFLMGSGGYLDDTTVEYGVHGVSISTTNRITVAASTLRYNYAEEGAGMAIYTGTHYVANTRIYSNVAMGGGGVWLAGGDTLFEDCTVDHNVADSGGGLVLWGDGAPTLRHCDVHNNVASFLGGGVAILDANAVIEADTFIHDNVITGTAGGFGGGVSIGFPVPGMTSTTVVIRDSRVTSNTCFGEMCIGGGVGAMLMTHTVTISGSLIAGNVISADVAWGGGIGSMGFLTSSQHLDGNVIRDNRAQGAIAMGGGISLGGLSVADGQPISVTHSLVFNNLLFNNCAEALDPSGVSLGGGIAALGFDSYLVNNTVVSNAAVISGTGTAVGGGVALMGGALSNTIVVSNTTSDGGGVWFSGTVGYNDVWHNTPNNYSSTLTTLPITPAHDISLDPLFVGSGNPAAFYHLRSDSPCIDRGTSAGLIPDHDYDGETRPYSATWDIGFDEFAVAPAQPVRPVGGFTMVYTPPAYLPVVLRPYQ